MRSRRIHNGASPQELENGAPGGCCPIGGDCPEVRKPLFVHHSIANGLTVSTCLFCQKVFASPTAAGLKLAEAAHKCKGLDFGW